LSELTDSFFEEMEDDTLEEDDIPPGLLNLGTHLTNPQRLEQLDPVIGREKELERMLQILTRRTKNNPVLLGEPGVGKTALVEALAQRINQGQVPYELADKKIVSLEIGSLVAGTMYRGEFEQRLKTVLNELTERPDIILFIDELHTIVGAGSANGSVDAANILKPALARGKLRCIGATTLNEYRQYIENDGALERRFQPITVNEPTATEARQMLAGLKSKYEQYHGVQLSDEILDAAINLSEKHIPDRFLPDKAIDLLDEAAANLKMKTPTPKAAIELLSLKKQLKESQKKKERAVMKENFTIALHHKEKTILLQKRIEKIQKLIASDKRVAPAVSLNTLADVLTGWTGVPIARFDNDNQNTLLALEKNLSKNVVGQKVALDTVANILRRAKLGLSSERRPLASFLFVGPSGVGKTTLAKSIAKELFGDQRAILQLDMSEYSESHSISKLIGSPAGYVGYKESGFLTEQVRRRPHQVILFDELDKAHLDITHLLQQLLEEGSLRDSSGKLVNFKQTIIVATANPNRDTNHLGFGENRQIQKTLSGAMDLFSNELRDRFDSVVPFQILEETSLKRILDIEILELNKRMAQQKCAIKLTNGAKRQLVKEAQGGARQLRQLFTEHAEHLLATKISQSKQSESHYTLDYKKQAWCIT
jgi:ATP-dependent Clp protease ATP-binding subunit ClpC